MSSHQRIWNWKSRMLVSRWKTEESAKYQFLAFHMVLITHRSTVRFDCKKETNDDLRRNDYHFSHHCEQIEEPEEMSLRRADAKNLLDSNNPCFAITSMIAVTYGNAPGRKIQTVYDWLYCRYLRNDMLSNTAAWSINYRLFTIEWHVFTWKIRCALPFVLLIMWLPLNTELYGGYSIEKGTSTTDYSSVSGRLCEVIWQVTSVAATRLTLDWRFWNRFSEWDFSR